MIEKVVARDGVEPPMQAFSELIFPVFPTTSMVAVGLLNTGKYDKDGWIVGDVGDSTSGASSRLTSLARHLREK